MASPRLSPSPSIESLASAHTHASYSHDYASDDYESEPDAPDAQSSPESEPQRPTLPPSTSTPSLTAASRNPSAPNFFGPPFYGRPPTPLPQTPSLTSLFRPSRPTTPDGSDDEQHHHQHHQHHPLGSEFAETHPHTEDEHVVRRASPPRVPTYEYYGFVLYLFSSLCFGAYLLWAFLPSPFLHALGIYYYPNRWWALAVPAFLVASVAYVYVALAAYNTEMLAVRIASAEAMVDGAGKIAVIDGRGRIRAVERRRKQPKARDDGVMLDWKTVWSEATDAVMDVPLAGVCEVLYGESS